MRKRNIKSQTFSGVVSVKGNRHYFAEALGSLQAQCRRDDLEVYVDVYWH